MASNIFLDRYRSIFGENARKIEIAPAIRINTLKTDATRLLPLLEKKGLAPKKIPFLSDGYRLNRMHFSLASMPEHLLGHFYIQEAASQCAAEVLAPKPGDLVLDMCSAPGGKTTQMAQLMGNKGTIVALELKSERLHKIKNNLERMGISNCILIRMDAKNAKKIGLTFDKILLDAPCSGNFMTDDDWFEKRTIPQIKRNAQLQRELLSSAASVLAEDGILVYSTCSLEPEENEENVSWTIENLGLSCVPTHLKAGDMPPKTLNTQGGMENCRRFWPHKMQTQGFFIAKFKKDKA